MNEKKETSKLARAVSLIAIGASLFSGVGEGYLSCAAISKYVRCARAHGDSGPGPNVPYDKCVGEYKGT